MTEAERERFFALSPDLLCVVDHDGFVRPLNGTWERLLGWSIAELAARPYLEFVHPDDRKSTHEATDRLRKDGFSTSFENRYMCKDGSFRWLQWSAYAIPEERRIYATVRDFSQRKGSEDRMAAQYAVTRVLAEATSLTDATPQVLKAVCESLHWDMGRFSASTPSTTCCAA